MIVSHHVWLPLVVVGTGLLAGCASPGSASPEFDEIVPSSRPAVMYRPSAGAYIVEERIQREQDFGGRTQPTRINRRMFVRADLLPTSAEPHPIEITISVDSLVADPDTHVPGTNLTSLYEAARGLVFRALYHRPSETLSFVGGDTTSQVSQEALGMIQHLFPRIPDNGVSPGVRWTDTTDAVSHAALIALQVHAIADHRVRAWIQYEGIEALEILTEVSYVLTGSGTQAGQEVELDGQGTRSVRTLLGTSGSLLGTQASDSVSMLVRVISAGISVPVVQTTTIITRREG